MREALLLLAAATGVACWLARHAAPAAALQEQERWPAAVPALPALGRPHVRRATNPALQALPAVGPQGAMADKVEIPTLALTQVRRVIKNS
jgi:hypothetical protein